MALCIFCGSAAIFTFAWCHQAEVFISGGYHLLPPGERATTKMPRVATNVEWSLNLISLQKSVNLNRGQEMSRGFGVILRP